jgi:hypothetical protein
MFRGVSPHLAALGQQSSNILGVQQPLTAGRAPVSDLSLCDPVVDSSTGHAEQGSDSAGLQLGAIGNLLLQLRYVVGHAPPAPGMFPVIVQTVPSVRDHQSVQSVQDGGHVQSVQTVETIQSVQ